MIRFLLGFLLIFPILLVFPVGDAAEVSPLSLEIHPEKQIYTKREGLAVRLNLHAAQPVKLCLEKDPMTQFQFQVTRLGQGQLTLNPLVVQDNRELFFEHIRVVELKPGQDYSYRLNLKRLGFSNGDPWLPGDYTLSATFNLCDQATAGVPDSSGKEVPIRSKGFGRFMIAE